MQGVKAYLIYDNSCYVEPEEASKGEARLSKINALKAFKKFRTL